VPRVTAHDSKGKSVSDTFLLNVTGGHWTMEVPELEKQKSQRSSKIKGMRTTKVGSRKTLIQIQVYLGACPNPATFGKESSLF